MNNQTSKNDWSFDMSENELVQQNLGLVKSIVNTFNPRDYDEKEELFSRGLLALLRAIRKYDPQKGKFSSYAWTIIRRECIQFFKQKKRRYEEITETCETATIELSEYMPILTDEEQQLVELRLHGHTLIEIAKIMNIKGRQVEHKLRKVFRKIKESNHIDD